MCHQSPCFPTPAEARRLIEEGLSDNLMMTYWVAPDNVPYALLAPVFVDDYHCIFHDLTTGLCQLHQQGLKPIEGRLAHHTYGDNDLRQAVCETWNSLFGLRVIQTTPGITDEDQQEATIIIGLHRKLNFLKNR